MTVNQATRPELDERSLDRIAGNASQLTLSYLVEFVMQPSCVSGVLSIVVADLGQMGMEHLPLLVGRLRDLDLAVRAVPPVHAHRADGLFAVRAVEVLDLVRVQSALVGLRFSLAFLDGCQQRGLFGDRNNFVALEFLPRVQLLRVVVAEVISTVLAVAAGGPIALGAVDSRQLDLLPPGHLVGLYAAARRFCLQRPHAERTALRLGRLGQRGDCGRSC